MGYIISLKTKLGLDSRVTTAFKTKFHKIYLSPPEPTNCLIDIFGGTAVPVNCGSHINYQTHFTKVIQHKLS